jgi:mono/diheme cytochrome c family protein
MINYRIVHTLVAISILALQLAHVGAQKPAWQIPPKAKSEKSPIKATPDVLKTGRAVFLARCRKCHGPEGRGNGAQADPNHKPADLTTSKPDQNPDGVLFYKVANGMPPDMPAFKGQLTPNEIWTVVEYVKSLRRAS